MIMAGAADPAASWGFFSRKPIVGMVSQSSCSDSNSISSLARPVRSQKEVRVEQKSVHRKLRTRRSGVSKYLYFPRPVACRDTQVRTVAISGIPEAVGWTETSSSSSNSRHQQLCLTGEVWESLTMLPLLPTAQKQCLCGGDHAATARGVDDVALYRSSWEMPLAAAQGTRQMPNRRAIVVSFECFWKPTSPGGVEGYSHLAWNLASMDASGGWTQLACWRRCVRAGYTMMPHAVNPIESMLFELPGARGLGKMWY